MTKAILLLKMTLKLFIRKHLLAKIIGLVIFIRRIIVYFIKVLIVYSNQPIHNQFCRIYLKSF